MTTTINSLKPKNVANDAIKDIDAFLKNPEIIPRLLEVYMTRDSIENIEGDTEHYLTIDIEPQEGYPFDTDSSHLFNKRYNIDLDKEYLNFEDDEDLELVYETWLSSIYDETELIESTITQEQREHENYEQFKEDATRFSKT